MGAVEDTPPLLAGVLRPRAVDTEESGGLPRRVDQVSTRYRDGHRGGGATGGGQWNDEGDTEGQTRRECEQRTATAKGTHETS